ncbi:MAG: hypothetical protein OHK0023_21620 [Anaerolineae bacterium]
MKRFSVYLILVLLVTLFGAIGLADAQGGTGKDVTDDEVNNVAKKLYCPVCENITLDTCGTAACAQWRDEIRIQLSEGKTEQEVIDDFVRRFEDRVVGVPVNPVLRTLSLVTPWVLSAAALAIAFSVFNRWRKEGAVTSASPATSGDSISHTDEEYRQRLERDLAARR